MRPLFSKELIKTFSIFSRGTLSKSPQVTNEFKDQLKHIERLAKNCELQIKPLSTEDHQRLLDSLKESAEERGFSAY